MIYYRPILQSDPAARPRDAVTLAGGWCWFSQLERLERNTAPRLVGLQDLPDADLARLTSPRPALAGLTLEQPRLMGILNTTPDSFSDGGLYHGIESAVVQGLALAEKADIIDIGGESTRPGSAAVPADEELSRTAPVITALRDAGVRRPISIDTRKAAVAQAALQAGADIINDVAALSHDPDLAAVAANAGVPVCLMHAQGDPATMQNDPRYDDVLLDVYDYLSDRVAAAVSAGIPRARIVIDPGIGFGKSLQHNLTLLRGIALFHGLGCPVLLGASRKRFIGTIGAAADPASRMPGSVAVALAGISQGVQITRVHDISDTRQALRLWRAVTTGETA